MWKEIMEFKEWKVLRNEIEYFELNIYLLNDCDIMIIKSPTKKRGLFYNEKKVLVEEDK